ncbi:hypothetical protein OS242_14365 [Tumebacillus sp. DT12]|uniref:Uncharacterized protein n=1 Tax=Tumebacillus lacus TaxID=2995335 RepID=A0ABT3X5K5_9BACL|nr:hypothetical protein [Tumebacillus lacus]MCX7571132.1 hypothetical protein [Tumebacillus lacus]
MDSNPEYIKHWINKSLTVASMRSTIIGFMLILVDFFMIVPLYIGPNEGIYTTILLPPLLFLHAFALWIVIAPYKRQIVAHLYLGIFCAFLPIGYVIVSIRLIYEVMGVSSPLYGIVLVVLFLYGFYALFKWHFNNLKSGYYYKVDAGEPTTNSFSKYGSLGVIGMMIGEVILGVANGKAVIGALAGTLLIIGAAIGMMSVSIHKYILIRRHMDWVELDEPPHNK